MIRAAFFCENENNIERVYGGGRRAQVARLTDMVPTVISSGNFARYADSLRDVEAVFSTWGMPKLSDAELLMLPGLKCVFYAAGSVKDFARPLLERGITVVSAAAANAVYVAKYTLSQILLANKGFFRNLRAGSFLSGESFPDLEPPGNYGTAVGIIGAGHVGRMMIRLLREHRLPVLVYDPYLSDEAASALGAEKAELPELFARCHTVSNHVPDLPETKGMLHAEHFEIMRPGGVFINTGRGATVSEPDLVSVLSRRTDLTAILDVTFPEPPEKDSPLYSLSNIYITGHIAGTLGDEVYSMADLCIEAFMQYTRGLQPDYAVTLREFDRLA